MSTATIILILAIGSLVISLNVFCICDTWEKVTKMEVGQLPGHEIMEKMIKEMQEQRLTETGDYSSYFNEGINLAIDIAERYGKDLMQYTQFAHLMRMGHTKGE